MKTDYPELEGKTLTYWNGEVWKDCVTVGVNYHVGITVVNVNDKDNACICLSYKLHRNKLGYVKYRKIFHHFVRCIQKGSRTEKDLEWRDNLNKDKRRRASYPNINNCPWR